MGKINVGIIGAGMFGGTLVKTGASLGCPGIILNASKDDIDALGVEDMDNITTFVVGDGKGTGKSRDTAKEFLLDHLTVFEEAEIDAVVRASDVILVGGSAGGGFGSGVIPTTISVLNEMYEGQKLFIAVTVFPDASETYTAQLHAEAFMREILDQEIPYIIYDNDNFSNLPPAKMHAETIKTFASDLKVLRGDYIVDGTTDGSNMDERDLLTTLSTPGRLLLAAIDNFTEANIVDGNIINTMKNVIATSAHAKMENDRIVMASATMFNLSDEILEVYGSSIKHDVQTIMGEHISDYRNESTYTGLGTQFVALILSGCSAPNERINQIVDIRTKKENIITTRKASTNKLSQPATGGLKLGVKTFGGSTTPVGATRPSVAEIVKKMNGNNANTASKPSSVNKEV